MVWVKTRQEVELGIELSSLTHTMVVMQPNVSKAVISVDEDGSIDGFSINGLDAELPLHVIPRLPVLRELLVSSGAELPAHLVFARTHGDISVCVESTHLAASL